MGAVSSRRVAVAAVVALGLLVLVGWPLGAWDGVDREAARADLLAPGERHVGERYASRVDSAQVLAQRPGLSLDPEPGVAYLVVHGTLEARTDATDAVDRTTWVVSAGDLELTSADTVVLAVDESSVLQLQPRLETEVAWVWEIDEGDVVAGDPVRVSVVDRTAEESNLGRGTLWRLPRVGAVVDLVVS
jgi:hypothetical protein